MLLHPHTVSDLLAYGVGFRPFLGRLIPFDTYSLFYRDDLETTRLAPLRAAH